MARPGPKLIVGCAVVAVIAALAVSYASAPVQPPPADGGTASDMRDGTDRPGVQAGDSPQSTSLRPPIVTSAGSPVMGSPDAPITIIEFGDYQCHACHAWFHNTKPDIESNYIDTGKANLVFVDLAFLGRDSQRAAQASHCAGDQDMYWEYHDLLYVHQEEKIDSWAGTERLTAFAFSLDLDMQAFSECLGSNKHSERVRSNVAEATKAGAVSTPTFVIDGPGGARDVITGAQPYRVFERVLDSMLATA